MNIQTTKQQKKTLHDNHLQAKNFIIGFQNVFRCTYSATHNTQHRLVNNTPLVFL